MYRKIILPVDGSEASRTAAEFGFRLAGIHGAEVVIVSVLDIPLVYPPPMGGFMSAEMYPEVVQDVEAVLEQLLAEATRLGIQARTKLRRGEPAAEILELAKEEDADLILMAAQQHGRIASLLLGSVSQEILRKAPCPVQVIGGQVIEKSPALQAAAAAARGPVDPAESGAGC